MKQTTTRTKPAKKMKTYIFQIQTSDFELQLKTEVTGSTIEQVYQQAKNVVRNFPVSGMSYVLGYYEKVNNRIDFTLLKKDTITS